MGSDGSAARRHPTRSGPAPPLGMADATISPIFGPERSSTAKGGHAVAATVDIAPEDALRLLATIDIGRIAFARHALPTIRLVNHAVIDDRIIVHANTGTTLTPDRQVVAYEAGTIDADTRCGWCVVITGPSEEVTDPRQLLRYRTMLRPWLPGHRVIAIDPDIITGIRFYGLGARRPIPFPHRMN